MSGSSAEQAPVPNSALSLFAQKHPLILFFLLAYAWSWTLWLGVLPLAVRKPFGIDPEVFAILLILIGAFGPTLSALLTRWLGYRDLRICSVWTGWRNLIVGLVVGLLSFILVTVLMPTFALTKGPIGSLHWAALLQWGTYGLNWSTFLGGPVNEEPGWRGFALPRLQDRYGPYGASVILGLLWAAWHLPLFRIHGWSSASPRQFLLILIGISFLFTAAANLSRFNVIVAIMLHALFNTNSGIGNGLLYGLPKRSPEMLIYTLAVFVCGTLLGFLELGMRTK